ncbi:hypothetical protein ANN_04681 [Periplaneta americana]|uniref:Major facilitator superfamily associated domain-containing protein n=1 Tax=Periplaneta americana TaxID=6978 RepID=A0ABQ8TAA9_PERAM|nr:hypothetical protein ANN_04681 [Periplaneta americana]
MGCIFPFLPLHMRKVGLTSVESQIISAVAPLVALLGPWLACPLADRLSGLRANNGRGMRMMLALIILLAAVFYALLMCIPTVTRFAPDHKPAVSFMCGPERALLHHERCMEPACHSWDIHEVGELNLLNCQYDCDSPFAGMSRWDTEPSSSTTETVVNVGVEVEGSGDIGDPSLEVSPEDLDFNQYSDNEDDRERRDVTKSMAPEPPHLCYRVSQNVTECKVYTQYSKIIAINVSLFSNEELNPRGQYCHYDVLGYSHNVSCRIPVDLPGRLDNKTCIVRCDVDQDSDSSLLAGNPCHRIRGDPTVTFWTYLVVRSVADIFPTAALALLAAVIVVATRETSIGKGDVGRQLAWGWIGLALSGPIMGFLSLLELGEPHYWLPFVCCAAMLLCAALIVVFAKSLPLSQPEWWWHARGSVGHRYGWELVALTLILILLGIFWSALDSFFPWHVKELLGSELLLCLTLTAGALPAIPVMWFSEQVVDYCGHSNLLIVAFIFYIVRYTALYALWSPWWLLLCCEALELLTLSLAWLAAILYLRHLIPRHLTATGQGLAVAAHFCIGRCIGSILAGVLASGESGVSSVTSTLLEFIFSHIKYLLPNTRRIQKGPNIMSKQMVRRWCRQFSEGRQSVHDEERSGRPSLINDDRVELVRQCIMENRRFTITELSSHFPHISRSLLHEIVTKHLLFKKMQRLGAALTFLQRYHDDGDEFLDRIVTGDETWISHFTPETKQQSMHWRHSGSLVRTKFKQTLSIWKVICTVFWDRKGILLIDSLPRGVVLLHDNACPHTARRTAAVLTEFVWELFDHSPYSPDLAPSDFYVFLHLKKFLSSGAGSLMMMYQIGSVAAAVVATIYFIAYHCCFKSHWLSPRNSRGSPTRQGMSPGATTNGTYTPLRVYHNAGADGQKVQHRY